MPLYRRKGDGPKPMRSRSATASPQLNAGEESIEQLCANSGLKMTGQRRIIARVLSEAADHPDVEELYRRAVGLDARISIATVYRTVRLFEEKGILNRRDFGSGRARYEPNDHGQLHHLIDVETGNVIEFQSTEHEQLMRNVAQQLGFELVSLRLELFGRPLSERRRAPSGKAGAQGGRACTVGQVTSKRR
jgi:Fur family transcriptional regulator, ferric uptake regulator